jgi:hypothetical protein
MRIDAHVHYTPPSMAEDLPALAAREPYWGLLITPSDANHTQQGWATAERMIEDMDRAGIDRVVLMGEYRMQHESCAARNDQALALVKRWPQRVTAFACLQPLAGPAALDELERCLDGGMAGVGESNPYGQAHGLDHPDFLRLVEACARKELPLCLHVSEEIGHYYLGKSTTPLRHYHRLACRFPELKLILSHWGGGLFLYELMPEVRKDLRNVWYDTAGSPLLYPTDSIFGVALRCVGSRKLLYGSDYPCLIYPGRQTEADFCPFLEEIDELGLEPEVRADILGGNAARLLGWGPPAAERPGRSGDARELPAGAALPIHAFTAVTLVASLWPETRSVFEHHGIPCQDNPVPFWEPIVQAAAARGLSPERQAQLLDELNQAAGWEPPGASDTGARP